MKRWLFVVAGVLLFFSVSCRRGERPGNPPTNLSVTTLPVTSPVLDTNSATDVWLDISIRDRDFTRTREYTVLSHRFHILSGEKASWSAGNFRLNVDPVVNPDGTIAVAFRLINNRDSQFGAPVSEITLADGESGTKEVQGFRYSFFATTKADVLATRDRGKPPTFEEGWYVLHPSCTYYAKGDMLAFENGTFRCWPDTKADPSPPLLGRYHIDGEKLTLSFADPNVRQRTLHHRIFDQLNLLIADELIEHFDSRQELELEKLEGYYIHVEKGLPEFPFPMRWWQDWWGDVMYTHPKFAELFPINYR
ncbi:hypothetical protein ACXR0O_13720 [Verrucomicrobiota bacterium sgz303538]